MINSKAKTRFSQLLAIALGSMLTYAAGWVPTAWAQEGTAQLNRIFDNDDLFNQEFFNGVNPNFSSGSAFPPGGHTLQPAGGGKVVLVEPPKTKGEVIQTELPVPDPIDTAFDSEAKGPKGVGKSRLFFLDGTGGLLAVKQNAKDVPDPATIRRFDAGPLGLNDPQGMTFGAESLFILDGVGPRIVRIRATTGRNFDGPSAATGGRISEIPLSPDLGALRGLAFSPASGLLFVFSPSAQMLYGLTVTGEMVAAVKLPGFQNQPEAVQGMVFAPTLDLSDDPAKFALYIASSGPNRGVSEWFLGGGLDAR